jgi:LmbE family N-acetylglucosaminyl deacetylase
MDASLRILAIGAHPDDIEFGCGGTLAKFAGKGDGVYLLVMTEGDRGGDPVVRRHEQERAADLLGAKGVFWGGYRDTELPLNREMIQTIEGVVQRVEPDFIYVHYFDDTHQDHRHLALCTMTATRYTRNVLFYEGPTAQNFSPTVFTDIEAHLDRKLSALEAHTSQALKTNIRALSIVDIARASARFRGIQGRVATAEAFVPLRLFINVDRPA